MSVDLMLPRITGVTPEQQLMQIRSYLYQFSEQLRYALNNLGMENFSEEGKNTLSQVISGTISGMTPEQQNQYRELKALIIKTAHTVESFSEEISAKLKHEYVAQSEYGTFREWAEAQFKATAENITQYYERTSEIQSDLEEAEKLFTSYIADTSAYIRTGLLYENDAGIPIYGVEIGQKTTQIVDGQEVVVMSDLISRFTSDRLSFDQGEAEVADSSNQRLYITDAEVTGSLTIGDWFISTTNGFTLRYIGGDI